MCGVWFVRDGKDGVFREGTQKDEELGSAMRRILVWSGRFNLRVARPMLCRVLSSFQGLLSGSVIKGCIIAPRSNH